MSGDEEDDAFFFDEWFGDPDDCDTADCLAEQVHPSPVWVSYDPDWDMDSPTTDCEEYFCDEYYDEEGRSSRTNKDTKGETGVPDTDSRTHSTRAEEKLKDTRAIPELKLPERRVAVLEPTVIWRSRDRDFSRSPARNTVTEGRKKKVSLLSDWRERFNITTRELDTKQQSYQPSNIDSARKLLPLAKKDTREDIDNVAAKISGIPKMVPDLDRQSTEASDIIKNKGDTTSGSETWASDHKIPQAMIEKCLAL